MGQFQGGFALCTVTGAEILDQNFQRVNPIAIEEPTRGYVRMTLPGSSLSTVQRKIRIEREGGPVVTPDSPVTLTRVGASSAYLAPITLHPERYRANGAVSVGALEPIPDLTVALGSNSAVLTNPEGGGVDAKCGVNFPAVLQLRFVKRDGSALTDPDPNGPYPEAGMRQETLIGAREENYPEIVKVAIEAVNRYDPTQFCNCTSEVGIKEVPNTRYAPATRRFYTGDDGLTQLDSSGRINGQYVKLESGRKLVELKAVLDVRHDNDPAGTVFPASTVIGTPAYAGLRGAQLIAKSTNALEVTDGQMQYVAHWVDERSYLRKRGQTLSPTDVNQYWVPVGSPEDEGGGRDWLEKKIKDLYADWTGDGEVEAGMAAVDHVFDENDPVSTAVATCRPRVAVPGVPSSRTFIETTWTLWFPGMRRPAKQGELYGRSYDEAGFRVDLAPAGDPTKDNFIQTAIHEARHAWQYKLASISAGAQEDDDQDYMYLSPPTSAQVLKDARLSLAANDSGNPEYDALGELVPDVAAWGDEAVRVPQRIINAPKEADAIRISARSVAGTSADLVGCGIYALSDISRVGTTAELRVQANWKGRPEGRLTPYEGAAVKFEVVPGAGGATGSMLLSEVQYQGDTGSVLPDLRPLQLFPPDYPASAPVWGLIRQNSPVAVSRVRYVDGNNTVADARIIVVPPQAGAPSTTKIRATLVLPPECGAPSVPKFYDYVP